MQLETAPSNYRPEELLGGYWSWKRDSLQLAAWRTVKSVYHVSDQTLGEIQELWRLRVPDVAKVPPLLSEEDAWHLLPTLGKTLSDLFGTSSERGWSGRMAAEVEGRPVRNVLELSPKTIYHCFAAAWIRARATLSELQSDPSMRKVLKQHSRALMPKAIPAVQAAPPGVRVAESLRIQEGLTLQDPLRRIRMMSKLCSDIIFDSFLDTMAKYYGSLNEEVGYYSDLSKYCYRDRPSGLDFFRRQGWFNNVNRYLPKPAKFKTRGETMGDDTYMIEWDPQVYYKSGDEGLLGFFEFKLLQLGGVGHSYLNELRSGRRLPGDLCDSPNFCLEEYERLQEVENLLHETGCTGFDFWERSLPKGRNSANELLKHRLRWLQQCIYFSTLTVRFPSPQRVAKEFTNGRNFRTMTLCVSFDRLEGNNIRYHNPNLLSPFLRKGAGGVKVRPDGKRMLCKSQYLHMLGVSEDSMDRDYASWCSVLDTLTYLVNAKTIDELELLDAHMEIDSPANVINVVVVLNLWESPGIKKGAVETHFTWSIRDIPGECSRSATSQAGLHRSHAGHLIKDEEVQPDFPSTAQFHRTVGQKSFNLNALRPSLGSLCHTSALYSCFRTREFLETNQNTRLKLRQRDLLAEARLSTEGKSLQYVLPLLASVGTLAFAECNARPSRRSHEYRCHYPDEVWTEAYYICDTCRVTQSGLGPFLDRMDDPQFSQSEFLGESPLNAIFRARTATSVAASTLLSIQVLRRVRTANFADPEPPEDLDPFKCD